MAGGVNMIKELIFGNSDDNEKTKCKQCGVEVASRRALDVHERRTGHDIYGIFTSDNE